MPQKRCGPVGPQDRIVITLRRVAMGVSTEVGPPLLSFLRVLRCWRLLVLRALGSRRTRLTLHSSFVYGHRFLLRKRRSLGNEVEVSRLTLGAALARLQTGRIHLGPELVGGQVVLDVDRALGAQRLFFGYFRLVGEAHDGHPAVRHLLDAQGELIEDVLAVVVHTPRPLGVLLKRTLAPVLNFRYLLDRRHADRSSTTGAQVVVVSRSSGDGDGVTRIGVGRDQGRRGAAATQLTAGRCPAIGQRTVPGLLA